MLFVGIHILGVTVGIDTFFSATCCRAIPHEWLRTLTFSGGNSLFHSALTYPPPHLPAPTPVLYHTHQP